MIFLQSTANRCAPAVGLSMLVLCLLLIGCRGRKAADDGPVSYSQTPEQTVSAIMAQYDANKDGELDASELGKCPSLKTLLTSMNKGPAGKITSNELTERITQQQNSSNRVHRIPCEVFVDGTALKGATVTLFPESFHGQGMSKVDGIIGDDGIAAFTPEGGFVYGFYRVSISKQEDGQETIPSRYNTSTSLGVEVGPQTFGRAGIMRFDLNY